ncbi:LysR family transcriptional regulator [Streptomyces sp. MB09-01]|uniref:LysR family transcriptional regulator n=1 Tax=Streptomyces sp. MB09-01 TaxID=3028666 RepID=UPI0029B0DD75|nr:LysR family transcriptional regulator [Streptomyces sp. MB09-01]MDX3537511.1 LysR family transcriptional regulator [Streptomyces sp. MB09-01]
MRRDLDIRLLRTLITIVDAGGFRRAADVLNISQPAISQHIRRLDSLVGEPVFLEARQLQRLSPVGEELLRYARQLVRINDELVLHLGATQRRRRLALGVCDTLIGVIPGLLAALKQHVPLTRLAVQTGAGERLAEDLGEGTVDMVLRTGPPRAAGDQVATTLSCNWFGRPGLTEATPVPVAVCASKAAPLRRLTEETLGSSSVAWRTVYEGLGVEDVVTAARSGLGVGLLFSAADRLWPGLQPVPQGLLPKPVRDLPVTLSAGPRLPDELAGAALGAVRTALSAYVGGVPAALPS